MGRPTRALAGTTRLVKRVEKFMAQKGMLCGKRIPCSGLNGPERIDKLYRGCVFFQSIRSEVALTVFDYRIESAVAARALTPRW